VAQELGITIPIAQAFKRELQTSFVDYVNAIRILHAKKLLRTKAMCCGRWPAAAFQTSRASARLQKERGRFTRPLQEICIQICITEKTGEMMNEY
jgi:AraC-like DNA-binding protein